MNAMTQCRIPGADSAIADMLSRLPMFGQLDAKSVARLASDTTRIEAPRGAVLFRSGDPCRGLHAVIHGQVKISLAGTGGEEKVVELSGPGQTFGEAVLFLDEPHVATAQCICPSRLLLIAREAIQHEIDRNPRFARLVITGLSRRLLNLISDRKALTLLTGTQRVIGFLLHQSAQAGQSDLPRIVLPATKGLIASRLNLTHEHFSRVLHELVAAGLIEVRGRSILLQDMAGLRAYPKQPDHGAS